MRSKNKLVLFYLFLIAFHFAHVLEEVWGHFWMVDKFDSLALYLLINWILILIPILLLYFVILGKRIAYVLSIVYAMVMTLNGLGHNIATIITAKYFNGFAGGFSGLGLIVFSIPLIMLLKQNMPLKNANG